MQQAQQAFTQLKTLSLNTPVLKRTSLVDFKAPLLTGALLAITLGLTGCQTFKTLTGSDDGAVATASQTEEQYYAEALNALDKGHYLDASSLFTELRTFYPTGKYAQLALLELMYSQFQSKEYELAANNADLFIRLYPNNTDIDYAYYVRGVANMETGSNSLLSISKQNLAHRDTAYLRLAFANFQELINRFPTSPYVPDAAQRMSYIYNQFAENEMAAARWYIKREAYVAAANRAKWVFQYYPLSEQVPEAIAILAYSYDKLGVDDLALEYKTLLQINYPQWLTSNGAVRLNNGNSSSWINKLTFGALGRSTTSDSSANLTATYQGNTKTQVIYQAAQLQLAAENVPDQLSLDAAYNVPRRTLNIGLGLPESDSEQIGSQNSSSQIAADSVVNADDNVNPMRRTTLAPPIRRSPIIHNSTDSPTSPTTEDTQGDNVQKIESLDVEAQENEAQVIEEHIEQDQQNN